MGALGPRPPAVLDAKRVSRPETISRHWQVTDFYGHKDRCKSITMLVYNTAVRQLGAADDSAHARKCSTPRVQGVASFRVLLVKHLECRN
jgi:hypothetical protein